MRLDCILGIVTGRIKDGTEFLYCAFVMEAEIRLCFDKKTVSLNV